MNTTKRLKRAEILAKNTSELSKVFSANFENFFDFRDFCIINARPNSHALAREEYRSKAENLEAADAVDGLDLSPLLRMLETTCPSGLASVEANETPSALVGFDIGAALAGSPSIYMNMNTPKRRNVNIIIPACYSWRCTNDTVAAYGSCILALLHFMQQRNVIINSVIISSASDWTRYSIYRNYPYNYTHYNIRINPQIIPEMVLDFVITSPAMLRFYGFLFEEIIQNRKDCKGYGHANGVDWPYIRALQRGNPDGIFVIMPKIEPKASEEIIQDFAQSIKKIDWNTADIIQL